MPRLQKSSFVSALGTAFEMIKLIAEEVYSLGGNDNDLRRILKERQLRKEIARLLVNSIHQYQIQILAGSIAELVEQGAYDWSDPGVNDQNFQIDEMHQCLVVIKRFKKRMSTNAVLKALDKEGLRPATASELLEFGIRYHAERSSSIVALGSMFRSSLTTTGYVALVCEVDKRKLCLTHVFDEEWRKGCSFAAVRK